MKYAIRIALLVIIGYLSYTTFNMIYSELKYAEEVKSKEEAVIAKLTILRDAQLLYKDANGKFAGNFEDLFKYMETGKMVALVQEGDKDDSTTVFRSRKMEFNVRDSMFKNVDIRSLKFLPGSDTAVFVMGAGEIKKNDVTVPVFEIKDPYPFNKDRVKKNNPLKVGSLFEVNYNGNWK